MLRRESLSERVLDREFNSLDAQREWGERSGPFDVEACDVKNAGGVTQKMKPTSLMIEKQMATIIPTIKFTQPGIKDIDNLTWRTPTIQKRGKHAWFSGGGNLLDIR